MIKINIKQILTLMLLVFMLLSFLPLNAFASTEVKGAEKIVKFTIGQQAYVKGGTKVPTDVAPYIKDGRTMVPVAFVAPALGTDQPVWIPESQKVKVTRGDDLIMITIGSKELVVNGKVLMMNTAAEIKDIGSGGGRTMLPIAFIAKALNVSYQWDEETKSVNFYGYSENFNMVGSFGPTLGTETVYGDVTISSGDVRLQNKIIKGNLVIAESVGKGNVFLDNITVEGNTYVRGGGKDSIHINGGSFANVIIENTPQGGTRIVATNTQGINIVVATSQEGEAVVLEGSFANVEITATNALVTTQGQTTIQNIFINNTAIITVAEGTNVQNVIVNATATITGAGNVNAATVNVSNVVISTTTQPMIITAPDVILPTIQPTAAHTREDNGGGGGGGGIPAPTPTEVIAVTVTGNAVVGETLTSTPNPSNATGSYQWQFSGDGGTTWTTIPTNGTASTYLVTSDYSGNLIRVVFTASGNFRGTVTSANQGLVKPAISTLSEIVSGVVNPEIIVTLSGDYFATNIDVEDIGNWTFVAGATNLTLATVTRNSDTQVTIAFTGTAAVDTLSFKANAAALAGEVESNVLEVAVPVGALGGTVSITGDLMYNVVLTANVTSLTGNTGTLNYQWKRDGIEVGENQSTYTTVEADIGRMITVEITSSVETGAIIGTAGSSIVKEYGTFAPSAPTMASRTDTTIVLNVIVGAEYNVDGGEWQDSPEFTGLTPLTEYTFRARIKETATMQASLQSSPTSINTAVTLLPTVAAALTDDDESSSAVSSPVAVANVGGILNYTLTLTGLEVDKDVTYTITETSDPDNILTLPAIVTGNLTSVANDLQMTLQVAANAAGQPAKTATFTISFVGADYQPISDIVVVVNLAQGEYIYYSVRFTEIDGETNGYARDGYHGSTSVPGVDIGFVGAATAGSGYFKVYDVGELQPGVSGLAPAIQAYFKITAFTSNFTMKEFKVYNPNGFDVSIYIKGWAGNNPHPPTTEGSIEKSATANAWTTIDLTGFESLENVSTVTIDFVDSTHLYFNDFIVRP